MGQALLRLAQADAGLTVVGSVDKGEGTPGSSVQAAASLAQLNPPAGSVLIEFTHPEATIHHVREAAALGVNVLVGTTGFSASERAELEQSAARAALIIAANTSLGVNVLLGVVEQLARTLGDYDIELVEMHHRLKKDAPSGTAVALAEAAARGREVKLADVARNGRDGFTDVRPAGEIGIHAVRGGDVVGEHTMTFAGPGERIEVVHRAHSRDTFAAGALQAAKWLSGRPAGLYTMRDVLGI
jgi:4-hydroxy-tetrahydrodipicolinate reductase